MVQFASYTSNNLITESLYKLKHAAQKFKNVIVAHDMTKLEREECRRLVEEAKAEEEDDSGEYLYERHTTRQCVGAPPIFNLYK